MHCGYSGSLSVNDSNLIRRIQGHINFGRRQELYELGDSSVTLGNGVNLRVV